ncbi:MAG: zinc-ribbon domain-containing protein [Chloroflexota bacterium]
MVCSNCGRENRAGRKFCGECAQPLSAVDADRRTIEAGIGALGGRTTEASAGYREARRAWDDLGLPWDKALCAIDMATLLDPTDPDVRATGEAARQILVDLGAKPFIARLDAALTRHAGPPATGP